MTRATKGTYNGKNRATRRKRLRIRPKRRKELSHIEETLANAKDRGEKMLDAGLLIVRRANYLRDKYNTTFNKVIKD